MPTTKKEINEYLFWEFGFDLDDVDVGHVSDDWPFGLRPRGSVSLPEGTLNVFEFVYENETYFVLDRPSALGFVSAAGMTVEDVRIQEIGATWVGRRDPVDLDTTVIGYEGVPPAPERRAAIGELIRQAGISEQSPRVSEGLFLRRTGEYLALVELADGGGLALGSRIPVMPVPFPEATSWRRLSYAIGQLVDRGELEWVGGSDPPHETARVDGSRGPSNALVAANVLLRKRAQTAFGTFPTSTPAIARKPA